MAKKICLKVYISVIEVLLAVGYNNPVEAGAVLLVVLSLYCCFYRKPEGRPWSDELLLYEFAALDWYNHRLKI